MMIIWIVGLIVGYFGQETCTLTMERVMIPSYKLRGETAILECQYELNGSNSGNGNNRKISYNHNNNNNNNNNKNYNNNYDGSNDDDSDENNDGSTDSNNRKKQQEPYSHNNRFFNQNLQQLRYNETTKQKYSNYFYNGDYIVEDVNSYNHANNHESNKHNNEALYSVKWYKDNEEFYRYVPKDNPPQHSYVVDGVKVDHRLSNDRRVALKQVSLKSKGLYRCEVSAEAPNFETVSSENMMEVIYLPQRGPIIEGGEQNYEMGDLLNLTCKSGKSYPASKLNWIINNRTITDPKIVKNHREIHHTHGLITTELSLQFIINGKYFVEGALRAKCVATISPVLWRVGKEKFVQYKPPPLIDNREAMFLVRGAAARIGTPELGKLNFYMWFTLVICRII